MEYRRSSANPDVVAPDGSEITLLSTSLSRGSMVLCTLGPGAITKPIRHKTVDEMWHVVSGSGRLWRSAGGDESVVDLAPGVSAAIPVGTSFQFRCDGTEQLRLVIATMPPWPGDDEAEFVTGEWPSTV